MARMPEPSGEQHLVLQRDLGEIERMARWVDGIAERAGLSEKVTFGLQLCLEEAVVNIIRYAFTTDGEHQIVVVLAVAGDTVIARIEDDGQPFNPLEAAAPEHPSSLDEAQIGGLGIHLMRQFATRIDYRRAGTDNRLTLVFAKHPDA